jgi:gamma-D-glutamyl-L-lysine dipeptidyl-peptidase
MTSLRAAVDVATMWTSPTAPRPIDAPAVSDVPDVEAWTQAMDANARLGLHGRTLTQLLRGEPVELVDEGPPGWIRVAARWQPCPEDPRGYPGWVRTAHFAEGSSPEQGGAASPGTQPAERMSDALLAAARRHLGLGYLWGGTSPWGFDCSGLVHYCHRQLGIVVPRDASAQQLAARQVPIGDERPGDLYFFAASGSVDHVGFVTGDATMLHAPETGGDGCAGGGRIEEGPLAAQRRDTLAGVGRLIPL